MESTKLLVLTNLPDRASAEKLADLLVGKQLAACVNILAPCRSVYRWKGKVWNETEQLLVIKTTAAVFEDVKRTVKELHSYELPEILALPVSDGEASALAWIGSSVRHGRDNP